MKTFHVSVAGRFGNCVMQYAHARSLAESEGATLTTSPWIGMDVFDLPYHKNASNAITLPFDYHQKQESLTYTRSQFREWFQFRPEIREKLERISTWNTVAHRRVGDYPALGYPVVSVRSYTTSYGVTLKSSRDLRDSIPEGSGDSIDNLYAAYNRTRRCYITQPRLFVQYENYSDLQGRVMNNAACMEDGNHEAMV